MIQSPGQPRADQLADKSVVCRGYAVNNLRRRAYQRALPQGIVPSQGWRARRHAYR